MRALCIACNSDDFSFEKLTDYYLNKGCAVRQLDDLQINSVYEQLFLALNQTVALQAIKEFETPSDLARTAIVSWYYAIYNAASAMICARDGSVQEDHMSTAKQWVEQICRNGLAKYPFDACQDTLRKQANESYVRSYKEQSAGRLQVEPHSANDARGALGEYVSGCLSWYRWRAEEQIKRSKEFKELAVENFRTKRAQELRDSRFDKGRFGFVHQAFRYRGKANYREALFLAYGPTTNTHLKSFADDLHFVALSFLRMAGAYCAVSLGKEHWNSFVQDVNKYQSFSTSNSPVWETK